MNASNDQTEKTGCGQRDVNLLEGVNRFQTRVVERVVLLGNGLLLRAHELVNGLTRLDGERHPVKEI